MISVIKHCINVIIHDTIVISNGWVMVVSESSRLFVEAIDSGQRRLLDLESKVSRL